MKNKPDFLCIGAQKAATTWLNRSLRSVPGIFIPLVKELHYFDGFTSEKRDGHCGALRSERVKTIFADMDSETRRALGGEEITKQIEYLQSDFVDDDWYRGVFGFAQENDICGEVCPAYMSLPIEQVEHVMKINPRVRIVVLLRDPVDRAWSQLRMGVRHEKREFNLDQYLSDDLLSRMFNRHDYSNSIPRWKAMVAEGCFRAIVYDRVEKEPDAVLNEVLEFIGFTGEVIEQDLSLRVNLGNDLPLPIELRAKLFEILQPQYEFLATMFPEYTQAWIARHEQVLSVGLT